MLSLQSRRIIPQQCLTHDPDWRESLAHECVVEVFQSELISLHPLVVVAQLHDLQLAYCVYEIRRITCTALGFLLCYGSHLVAFVDEKLLGFIEGHLSRMHFDSHYETRIS